MAADVKLVGLIGGAVGLGYGPLLVAILLHVVRLPTRLAAGSALMLGIFTAIPTFLGKVATNQVPLPEGVVVATVASLFVVVDWRTSRILEPRIHRWLLAAITALLAARVWITVIAGLGGVPRH